MAERAASQGAYDVAIAGEVVEVGSVRLVPVLQRRIGASRIGPGDAWSGYADSRLVGVWVAPESGLPHFLPTQTDPPGGLADWNAWLLESPALLETIAARLVRSPGGVG